MVPGSIFAQLSHLEGGVVLVHGFGDDGQRRRGSEEDGTDGGRKEASQLTT